ncbi:sugar ABC transporter ATP-binding protein [Brooklawnia cerclae]|uniref:Simple sugar transport system ATP-binding protein n=1 Tax=Brooklawnia cerclae TaxID=349934 RepID=A0ABX0SMW6_9ACTN|nr:sugar ABC transporter ATP-binding protein [Brooklawnia cerclae]NIH58380.1 simple sugar transport system ATP-binding protein [Brooklawnia cerclae]
MQTPTTSDEFEDAGGALPASVAGGAAPAVRCVNVSKRFGSVQALDGVDLELRRGQVHALVGENGSGKSTLTKIIAGAYEPDSGEVWIDGDLLPRVTPREALTRGVRVIYQDFALFPNMTVAENIGFEGDRPGLGRVPRARARQAATESLARLGLVIDPDTRLGDLSTAERQLVAIARAVSGEGDIILMDEPTAALTQDEIDRLLRSVRALAATGVSFVFISHKLREVVEIADHVTVIRDGRLIASGPADEFDQERIGFLMTGGHVVNERRAVVPDKAGVPVLATHSLGLGTTFTDVSLELHAGRVLGLAGLVGCGKGSIGLAIAGLIPTDAGTVEFRGRRIASMRGRPDLQYVPDDRLTEGLYLDWSIAENIIPNDLDEVRGRIGLLSGARQFALAEKWRDRLAIKTPTVEAPVSSLSGGNQQRVLLARSFAPGPAVVVFNNPTVGVDVGSRAAIHDLIRAVADQGAAVLLISDEPAEVVSLSDEVAFVVKGHVVTMRDARGLTEEQVIDIISTGAAA